MREEEEYLVLQNKFQDWFGEKLPANLPHPVKVDQFSHIKQKKRLNKSEKAFGVLFYSFGGAIIFGLVVGFIIYLLNLSVWRWNSYRLLIQFFIIFSVMVIGFFLGLVKVLASHKRKR